MPKSTKPIKAFDGGLVTSVNEKDLKDNECSALTNFSSRNIGSLAVLGGFEASSAIATIAEASFTPDITLASGANFIVFTTDYKLDNTEAAEIYIVYVDKSTGIVYIHDKTNDTWQTFLSQASGITPNLGGSMVANHALEASYYFADGGLRISNPNYDMANVLTTANSSTLLLSHIKRAYLGGNCSVDDWISHPSRCVEPLKNDTFANVIHFINGSTGGAISTGQFGITIDIDRDKGDGSIEMQGRSIYASFTYDNTQETMPKYLGTITMANIVSLASAPTMAELGYEATATSLVTFGDNNIILDEPVHAQDDGIKKDWDEDGMIIAEDANGQTQSLVYTNIEASGGGAKLTGVTGWVDTGVCSISYSIDDIIITAQGSGYAANETWTTSGGNPTTAASGTITVDGSGNILTLVYTTYGDGYDAVPTIVVTTSAGSLAQFSVTITAELTTSTECTDHLGVWSQANIAANATITFDPPGEIEKDDENLAIRPSLTFRPTAAAQMLAYDKGGNRITHVNLYSNKFEDDGGLIPETGDYAHLCSFDLANGHQKVDGQYTPWTADTTQSYDYGSGVVTATDQYTTSGEWIGSLQGENFQMRTGMFPDTWDTHIRWRTATVLNRKVYAGNISQKPSGKATYKHYPDRIVKSMPNGFDTFTNYDTLDVVVDDGDEIVALDNFGGSLLQFKKETLYIIDVTSEPEFLKATHKYRGIPNTNAFFRTDFGVIFGNSYGAFFYNGESIKELSIKTIEAQWTEFYTDDLSIGFEPKTKQAFFTSSFADYFLVYDMTTSSWMKALKGNRIGTGDLSNFFLYSSDLHIAHEGTDTGAEADGPIEFKIWKEDITASIDEEHIWESKEFDFDNASTNKIITKMYITYLSNAAPNLLPYWKSNTGIASVTTSMNETFADTGLEWRQLECTPVGGSISCKSLKVCLKQGTGAVDKDFQINDISVVYREKRVK